jgi:AcrR family transcriptional regulator
MAKTALELLGVSQATQGRERLLDVAIELFYRNGFNAVGLDRILAEAGVTKTTFYKHFESKDDLMVEAVRRRDAWESDAWGKAIHKIAGDDPREMLLTMFDVLDEWFNAPDFGGCLFINTAAEFPNPNDPVHQAAAAYKKSKRDAWRDLAAKAGASDAETFADFYTMLVEGTLILRQVHGRNDAARVARTMARELVDRFIPVTKEFKKKAGSPK